MKQYLRGCPEAAHHLFRILKLPTLHLPHKWSAISATN